jgi:acetyl-CoA C-acetyltransferase
MSSQKIDPRTPILVGVGQFTVQWDGASGDAPPSPHTLQVAAGSAALVDSGAASALAGAIDQIVVVRTMLDSVEGSRHPFGRCDNPPGALARDLGISGARHIYSGVGGDQPQALVNEACEDIFAGRATAVLLAGSEATGAMKAALKARKAPDWAETVAGGFEDRGIGTRLLSEYEIRNGLGTPTQTYPAFEHALRARLGLTRDQHLQLMSELWEGFSKVAETNPHSQFGTARTKEFLAQLSADNYAVADPYLKWPRTRPTRAPLSS